MLRVPAGTFMMGSEDGDADEKPVHSVTVASFEMDVTEVTVKAYRACVSAGAGNARTTVLAEWYEKNGGMEKWSCACNYGQADRGEHPMNCVDWSEARGPHAQGRRAACWQVEARERMRARPSGAA